MRGPTRPIRVPRWWFDWNLELQQFVNRVGIYPSLMDDHYPATDDHQPVHLDYNYPDRLNRWLPLVKWLLAIPTTSCCFSLTSARPLIPGRRGVPVARAPGRSLPVLGRSAEYGPPLERSV